MEIVKFPYKSSRRVFARRSRRSKNGTPEERAAKTTAKSTPATVIEISRRSVSGVSQPTPDAQRLELLEMARSLNDGQRELLVKYLRKLAGEGAA
jgi:hypothetical protein